MKDKHIVDPPARLESPSYTLPNDKSFDIKKKKKQTAKHFQELLILLIVPHRSALFKTYT